MRDLLKTTESTQPVTTKANTQATDIISVDEACRYLAIHRNTLYKLIQAREIPAFRLARGGRWKFRRGDLEQWIEDKQARGYL